MELLKEAVPTLSGVAVVWDPATPSHGPGLKAVKTGGPALGLRIQSVPVRSATEYDNAFTAIVGEHADAVLMLTTPLYIAGAGQLAELAIKHRLPLFGPREFAKAGGLLSFGPNRVDLFRRGAIYVDKVLKGANPADLPVEQPTKFELLINLKTAKALGLTVPPTLLTRSDEVIE
jgi:putative ABC transport system substrate-binding protein